MVTLDPRNKTIICNKCDKQIGFFDEKGEFTQSEGTATFMRNRLYDIDHLGKRMDKFEYAVDFCDDCSKQWNKLLKKFKVTRSKVPNKEDTS